MRKYKNFSIFIVLVFSLSLIFMSGCKNNNQSAHAKELVFGQINNKMPLDHTKSSWLQTMQMSNAVFEGLIKADPETGNKTPCLAQSYEVSKDNKEYTFYLKPDVKFHNGQILTARDVKFSIERVLSKETGSYMATNFLSIKGAEDMLERNAGSVSGLEIIDDYTIKIINVESSVPFLDYLGSLPIYPEMVCKEAGEKWGKEIIIGTGPFAVESFDINNGCRVKKFKDYHGSSPKIDSIYFKFFDELNTLMLDYEAKNVDFLLLSDKLADQYKNSEKYKSHVKSFDPCGIYFVLLNVEKEPWNNIKVREAFSYAVDVPAICTDLTNNKIHPAASISIPKADDGYDPDVQVKNYDPEKSLQLLKLANVSTPVKLEFPVTTLDSWRGQLVVAIQDQARKAGFEISTPIMDSAALNDLKFKGQRQTGIVDWYLEISTSMDQIFYTFFHSNKSTNYSSCYKNKEIDDLIENARKEFDQEKRAKLYKKIDKKIVQEDFVAIPIGNPKDYYMIHPWVKDFEIKSLKFPFELCDIDLSLKQ